MSHYNDNWPCWGGYCLAKNLKSKWGTMKHDVAKFCDVYA